MVSLPIAKGSVVKISYTITDLQGQLIEVVAPDEAVDYVHGSGVLLPAVEAVLEGQTEGFRSTVQLTPAEAFGPFLPELIVKMERSRFPEDFLVEPGMKFTTRGPTGAEMVVQVNEVLENEIILDGNHPLAGLDLQFEVRVLEIYPPDSQRN